MIPAGLSTTKFIDKFMVTLSVPRSTLSDHHRQPFLTYSIYTDRQILMPTHVRPDPEPAYPKGWHFTPTHHHVRTTENGNLYTRRSCSYTLSISVLFLYGL